MCNSRISVRRLVSEVADGAPSYVWRTVNDQIGTGDSRGLKVRCEPGFLRPGKDQPMAVEAGKTPPRVGLLWAPTNCGLLDGDRVTFVPNDQGQTPVQGTFELRVPPDEMIGYSRAHHIEVQIIEVATGVAKGERAMQDTESS